MKIENSIRTFASQLLQARVNGTLKGPKDVMHIANECQPSHGFSNQDWETITEFILLLESANNMPTAKKLAEEYNLVLEY